MTEAACCSSVESPAEAAETKHTQAKHIHTDAARVIICFVNARFAFLVLFIVLKPTNSAAIRQKTGKTIDNTVAIVDILITTFHIYLCLLFNGVNRRPSPI